jgi:hypothetical protein
VCARLYPQHLSVSALHKPCVSFLQWIVFHGWNVTVYLFIHY